MNFGAIAVSSRFLMTADQYPIKKFFDWIETNIKNQIMFTDRESDLTYIIGNSTQFAIPSQSTSVCPVYNLIFEYDEGIVCETGSTINV